MDTTGAVIIGSALPTGLRAISGATVGALEWASIDAQGENTGPFATVVFGNEGFAAALGWNTD
ncbi:MAG: hypothetical protein ACO376_04005 [Gammaproteobacteria bacterium]